MTAVEIMVVIAVLGVLLMIVIPQFSNIRENQVLKSTVADVLSSIDKARAETLSSLNSSQYGVYFQSDKIVIFKGTSYSALDTTNNEITSITAPANISNISLLNSGSNVYFNRLTGAPNTTGTVTISSTHYSKIVTIYATGVVSSN